ncbi:hypothetical protein AYY19_04060 [Photobacterium aquimaris]|uniref:PepSY domain-containing protein n=1 Tax=Photobacterium aquimaris TaxID=512643 RepID=A0A2T3IGF3_9GAMM|nr:MULTISPECIES: hypothetical protein [Photobacterium]OBU16340.1 hypothetical protein AYY19_04060 [Photobacterium aquimaris]OBU21504.1 hypothetical protein AYY20_14080 [Photobacterium aquimaris]PSU26050.1 hypothetical protein CTM88_16460 [Photobacterium aquimaris]PSW02254.1 hypothetical protein CTM91_04010 [Photobacterium aquimaris]
MKKHYKYLYLIGFISFFSYQVVAAPTTDVDEHHDNVMDAVAQGLIQPFSALQHRVHQQLLARIIRVELDKDDNEWIYELKLIDANNNIIKVEYEARTLKMIEIKGRHLESVLKVPK